MKKIGLYIAIGQLAIVGLIQLIAFGRDHTNLRVNDEPARHTPATRAPVPLLSNARL